MVNKLLKFLKKLPWKLILFLVVIFLGILWILSFLLPGKKNHVVETMISKTLDKVQDKQTDLVIEKEKIKTEQEVKLEVVAQQKTNLNQELNNVNQISDKKKKVEELIKLHNKIKQERGVK